MREPVDPGPETQPSLEARPDPHETQPSLEARPDPHESPATHSAPPGPLAAMKPADAPAGNPPTKAVDAPAGNPPTEHADATAPEPVPMPAQPVVVPAQYHYLKRPTFVLVLSGVWFVAALIGLGLYDYWLRSLNKTPAVFAVLVFVIVCAVGAQLLAMVEHKPLVTAVAIAVLSAPFAATAAAAALYGAHVFHWIPR